MSLKKIFLLPPLKGLNLYDNPFTMTPDYAIELENFMPPTTTFKVRPACEYIMELEGQVRGLYNYNVGATKDYGAYWYLATIKYGAADLLLIKLYTRNGNTYINKFSPKDKSFEHLAKVNDSFYNDDVAIYKHTLFLTSSNTESTMLLYHQAKGIAHYTIELSDGSKIIADMQNITIFKNWIFLSQNDGLNIYYIKAQYADILDEANKQWWSSIENIFTSHFGKTTSLEGLIQKGGRIIKIMPITKSNENTLDTFLMVVTDNGEIVLYDFVSSGTGENEELIFSVQGKFEISPPLNKFCFCEMEGDVIVATHNGLISLRRVIFGTSTPISENLEYRIMSLFSKYMFTIPEYSDNISLYYHAKNRLLIFNLPTEISCPLNTVVVSYILTRNKMLLFPTEISDEQKQSVFLLIKNIIVANLINYEIILEFYNGDRKIELVLRINTVVNYNSSTKCNDGVVSVSMNIFKDGVLFQELLKNPLQYQVSDLDQPSPSITLLQDFNGWNDNMKYITSSGENIYAYFLSKIIDIDDGDYELVNIIPKVNQFYTKNKTFLTLDNVVPGSLEIRNFSFFKAHNNFESTSIDTASIDAFFKSEYYAPTKEYNFNEDISIYYKNTTNQVSFIKLLYRLMQENVETWRNYMYAWPITFKLDFAGNIQSGDTNINVKWGVEYTINYFTDSVHKNTWICNIYAEIGSGSGIDNSFYEITYQGTHHILYQPDRGTPCWIKLDPALTSIIRNKMPGDEYNIDKNNAIFTYNGNCTVSSQQADRPQNITVGNVFKNRLGGDNVNFNKTLGYLFGNVVIQSQGIPPTIDNPAISRNFTNIDLKVLPFFNNINIMSNFRSDQYVFDSHFGTWSSFKDINIFKAIEHNNDFYFVRSEDIIGGEEYLQNNEFKSKLFKFNSNILYDETGPQHQATPIKVKYKTVDTFDFSSQAYKFLKRITIFGTSSTFWQRQRNPQGELPFTITPYVDFREQQTVSFIHAYDENQAVSSRVFKKLGDMLKNKRGINLTKELGENFSYKSFIDAYPSEKRKFWELYISEVNKKVSISIPLISNPGIRIGLEVNLLLMEAYSEIFGFEIYYDEGQNLIL